MSGLLLIASIEPQFKFSQPKKKFIVISVCEIQRSSLLYTYLDLEVSVTYFLYPLALFALFCTHLGEGNGNPLQYSCLAKYWRGAWQAAVHGVARSWKQLSDFTFTFHFHSLEKEMATDSNILAWRIPGTGEPGGLPSMGWHRVGHD